MKTYLFALAVVAVVIASVCNAACVKASLKQMGRINIALTASR